MSKYTTEVRYICEKANDLENSVGYLDVDDIIEGAIPSVFSFDFPIFDETYREVICTKILRHYYTREIGFETVGLWKLKLQTKLNEVMPYFNQLYKSELLKFNPLYDVDLQTTHVGNKDSESTNEENRIGNAVSSSNRSGTNSLDSTSGVYNNVKYKEDGKSNKNTNTSNDESGINYDLYSDTPQGALNGVNAEEYLTNARKITDSRNKNGVEVGNDEYNKNSETEGSRVGQENNRGRFDESGAENKTNNESMNGTSKVNSTENYVLHVVGKQAGISYSKMLKEFRETFLNIDMDVINSLSDLFLNLW